MHANLHQFPAQGQRETVGRRQSPRRSLCCLRCHTHRRRRPCEGSARDTHRISDRAEVGPQRREGTADAAVAGDVASPPMPADSTAPLRRRCAFTSAHIQNEMTAAVDEPGPTNVARGKHVDKRLAHVHLQPPLHEEHRDREHHVDQIVPASVKPNGPLKCMESARLQANGKDSPDQKQRDLRRSVTAVAAGAQHDRCVAPEQQ